MKMPEETAVDAVDHETSKVDVGASAASTPAKG